MSRFASSLLALSMFTPISVKAVAQQDSALVLAGQGGRPTLVKNSVGEWSSAVRIYSDDDLELFVPDTLTLGGVAFDGETFRKDGTYATYIYSFYKNDSDCRRHRIPEGHEADPKFLDACSQLRYQRRTVKVDTRKETLEVLEAILMFQDAQPFPNNLILKHQTIRLDGADNPVLAKAVTHLTALIAKQANGHPTQ